MEHSYTALVTMLRDEIKTYCHKLTTAILSICQFLCYFRKYLHCRFGRKKVMMSCMVGITIASLGLAFSPNIVVFGVLRILIGMCGPGVVDMGALICMLFKCIFVSLLLYIHPTALTYRILLSPATQLPLSFFILKIAHICERIFFLQTHVKLISIYNNNRIYFCLG